MCIHRAFFSRIISNFRAVPLTLMMDLYELTYRLNYFTVAGKLSLHHNVSFDVYTHLNYLQQCRKFISLRVQIFRLKIISRRCSDIHRVSKYHSDT
jgi:hypothetical protein